MILPESIVIPGKISRTRVRVQNNALFQSGSLLHKFPEEGVLLRSMIYTVIIFTEAFLYFLLFIVKLFNICLRYSFGNVVQLKSN